MTALSACVSMYLCVFQRKRKIGRVNVRLQNISKSRGSAAFVCSPLLPCYNLYWAAQMLMARDGPAVIDHIGLFVENRDFFIPHLHSTPALILIVLSRLDHTIQ